MFKKQKGLSIRFLTFAFAIITLLVFAVLFRADNKFALLNSSINKFLVCQDSSRVIKDSVNYLAEQSRLFVLTRNTAYAESFLNEKDVKKSREKALEQLGEICSEDELAYQRLRVAQNQADNLISIEVYAIRLIYESLKDESVKIPESIESVKLREIDENLSKEKLQKYAFDMLLGDGYLLYKQRVDDNCNLAVESMENEIKDELKINSATLEENLKFEHILQILLFAFSTVIFIFLNVLVLHVLKEFTKAIQKNERLPFKGAAELKFFAETYNSIYEIKKKNEKNLIFDAEYDALTGILNRRAYNQICKKCAEEKGKIALILIDLDNFKNINDTYGHSGGDTALKEVARLLRENFKSDDYVCRIGGDEFAVIMKEVKAKAGEAILRKIRSINELLAGIKELSNVSVSAGAALSDEGYSKDLYEKADKALYYVKDHGRSGCKIYSADCEKIHE